MSADSHLSDQELLLAADGELDRRRAARAQKHLSACWSCRARLTEIENSVANFVRAYEEKGKEQRSGSAALARLQFETRLAQTAATPPRDFRMVRIPSRVPILAGLSLAVVLLFVTVSTYQSRSHREFVAGHAIAPFEEKAVPDRRLTPGATRRVTRAEVCSSSNEAAEQTLPIAVQWKVFEEYGMPNARPDNYEVDHLITPALGGSDDLRNLWPEPHSDTVWNSYVKDQLEERLHRMVCDGSVDLATAQNDIATNWIAAYKKYLKAESPLPGNPARGDDPREENPQEPQQEPRS